MLWMRLRATVSVGPLPGGQPDWPPVRDLRRNLYSFREDVIRAGNREYIFELLGLDYWLLSTGARRRCGELFTTGLESYRTNYQISVRVADREVRELLRDRAWTNSPWTITRGELEDPFPYAIELVRHQERMLSDALHLDHPGDFETLHSGFETCLRLIRWDWDRRDGKMSLMHWHNFIELCSWVLGDVPLFSQNRAGCRIPADSWRCAGEFLAELSIWQAISLRRSGGKTSPKLHNGRNGNGKARNLA